MEMKKKCSIFIPRNLFSFFLILSHLKTNEERYIIINNFYFKKIDIGLIDLFKKKKFKIILINQNLSYKFTLKKNNNKFINFFLHLKNICKKIKLTKYKQLDSNYFINKYKKIDVYSSNILLDSMFCKNIKNGTFYFLEHGAGNFLEICHVNSDFKTRFINLLTFIFLKLNGIYIQKYKFYIGICGNIFNISVLKYFNYKIKILKKNYKSGFKLFSKFYRKNLNNSLRRLKNKDYFFLNIPYHYDFNIYKKFINKVIEDTNQNKKIIFIVKEPNLKKINNKYFLFLENELKKNKIKLINIKNDLHFLPAEIFLDFFKVKRIYSAYSFLLFTSHYLFSQNVQINLLLSPDVIKKYNSFTEMKPFSLKFIQNKFKGKNINFIDF